MSRQRSAGGAMVEFAIVMPLMLTLFFGVVELGRALYQQNTVYKAVSTGARYLARVNGIVDKTTCEPRDGWSTAESRAKALIVHGDGATPLLPGLDETGITITLGKAVMTMSGEDKTICVIAVQAEVDFSGLFGESVIPFAAVGPIRIRSETEERYIGL